jgi:transcription elongation GreA/GreB family factor
LVGDVVAVVMPGGVDKLEVVDVEYPKPGS